MDASACSVKARSKKYTGARMVWCRTGSPPTQHVHVDTIAESTPMTVARTARATTNQVGIINPSEMSPAAGIEIAIWAAVGGRGTLVGPIVGAFFVNGAKSWFTQAFPEFWLYFLGGLFIAVTLFLPHGIVGLMRRLAGKS